MGITELLGLLGGLALFLYGMQMMSNGLEEAAGNRMKSILEKLTSNRFLGVLVGAGITAVIQSSSATTVMVVGFVNSGMMTLKQAVWIIMGANIGTTITGQLIALDVGAFAPLFAFIGVAMIVFLKSPKVHHIGKIMAGLGVLFIGMDMMGNAMEPLKESQVFIDLMTTFDNPLVGIFAGALFTALIQSSSASVGILQTLAETGVISFSASVFVLFGMNIGTCITAVLASIGSSRSAKRTTVIHLSFNIIGTVLFTALCLLFPIADLVENITPGIPEKQIANMHTIFNIVTTLLLIPFGTYLANFAEKVLPEPKKDTNELTITSLNKEFGRSRTTLGSTAVQIDVLAKEVERMIRLAGENTEKVYNAIINKDIPALSDVEATEEIIDGLNKDISQYISKVIVNSKNSDNALAVEKYFLITGNAERIGDHACNIGGYLNTITKKSISFSEQAINELGKMRDITKKAIDLILNRQADTTDWLCAISAIEQQIDDMTVSYRESHLERMRQGLCSEEACVLYSELLTDFERIGDHALNIAQAYSKIPSND